MQIISGFIDEKDFYSKRGVEKLVYEIMKYYISFMLLK